MERTIDDSEDTLIELGAVTDQTKGAVGGKNDTIGQLPQSGLSDD